MLINKKAVKEYALVCAKSSRPRFTRISKEFYIIADSKMRTWIADYLHRLPSVGKTTK